MTTQAGDAGIELAKTGFGDPSPPQRIAYGWWNRTRTCDILINSQALIPAELSTSNFIPFLLLCHDNVGIYDSGKIIHFPFHCNEGKDAGRWQDSYYELRNPLGADMALCQDRAMYQSYLSYCNTLSRRLS